MKVQLFAAPKSTDRGISPQNKSRFLSWRGRKATQITDQQLKSLPNSHDEISLANPAASTTWPAPEDTELSALTELAVDHGRTEVYPGVQALSCPHDQGSRRIPNAGIARSGAHPMQLRKLEIAQLKRQAGVA